MDLTPGQPWRAETLSPAVHGCDLQVDVRPHYSGWTAALARPPRVRLETLAWQPGRPGVVSIPIARRRPRVRTCKFAAIAYEAGGQPPSWDATSERAALATGAAAAGDDSATALSTTLSATQRTRVAPPEDIVKLEDRLFYVLQPPLESLLGGALALPFRPFPYQYDGVAFLYPRHAAVLADEMGLGKTMQTITAVRLLLHAGELRRVLLICPKPLVTNWQREFDLWAPEIPLTVVEGDRDRRHWQWGHQQAVVTLANYELVIRDREALSRVEPAYDLVVLDESQRIKNRGSATSEAICSIGRRRSWALTGTPVENSADDLVGIFEFVAPGLLTPGMRPRQVAQNVRDHVLRRTKDAVLEDLPPKLVRDAELRLTPAQYETYREAEEQGIVRLSALGDSITVQHVFQLILRLKQICNFDPVSGESAKLTQLEADLEEIAASGKKAIVFSQWVKTLMRLSHKLARFGPLEYHGRVPARRRDEVIERFRRDERAHVILMSYGAGGVGLNLQFAQYVFLFDRWWNPAVEDQAIARAHRVGATGAVTVSRYLAVNTIEERINQILIEKRELFDTIFADSADGPGRGPRELGLSRQEIFGLFDWQLPGRDAA